MISVPFIRMTKVNVTLFDHWWIIAALGLFVAGGSWVLVKLDIIIKFSRISPNPGGFI